VRYSTFPKKTLPQTGLNTSFNTFCTAYIKDPSNWEGGGGGGSGGGGGGEHRLSHLCRGKASP